MRFYLNQTFILILSLFFSGSALAQYCMPTADCSEGDGVVQFTIGPFTNSSGCEADNDIAGYADFTALTGMDLGQGVPYSVTLLSGYDSQQISIWIDGDNSMSFDSTELILTDAAVGTEPTSFLVTIPALPLGNYRMRVQSAYSEPSSPDACLMGTYGETEDYTVNIVAPPSCIPVSNISSSSVGAYSAVINWDENGSATAWDIEIVESGNMPTGTPTADYNDIAMGVMVSGLMPVTAYDVYVRADCGQDDTSDVSSWSGPHTFVTACAEFAPPYAEPFTNLTDGLADCWAVADNGNPDSGPTEPGTSFWNVAGFGNVGSEGAMRINLYQGDVAKDWLISPIFDLSASEGYQVEFDFAITEYANTNPTNLGSDDEVVFLISTDAGGSWTALQTWTSADNVSPAGEKKIYDLTAYNGMNVMFAFWATDGTVDDEEDNDIFVDNFYVRTPPTCIEIAELTVYDISAFSAFVNWTENGSATAWDIEFGAEGFTPTGMPTTGYNDIDQMVELTGLQPVTTYDVYVRPDCGMDNESDVGVWIGPITFTTDCDVYMAPYSEDFATFIPDCWTLADEGDPSTGPTDFGSSSWSQDGFANDGFEGAVGINLYATGKNDWLISPDIVLAGGNFQVEFDFSITTYAEMTPGTLGQDDRVMFLISTDDMATWTLLHAWTANSMVDPAGEHMVFDLSDYVGMTVNFAFWGTEGNNDDEPDNDIFVDNFAVNEAGVLPVSIAGTVSNVSCNGAEDGSIDLTVTGGVAPYTFIWSSGHAEEDIFDLTPGTYTVAATDAEGTITSSAFTVVEPAAIETTSSVVNESVAGANDGSIDLTVSGGTAGYTFSWDTGATTEDIDGLTGGTYCVTITDANGCEETLCVEVMEGPNSTSNIEGVTLFRVYPNPVSTGEFNIEMQFSSNKNLDIELVNVFGLKVFQTERNNVSDVTVKVETADIPAGVYFVKVTSLEDNQQMIYRVVRQ